jgi:GT2 family glycosyltransferase
MRSWRRFKRWYRRPFRRRKFQQVTLNEVSEETLDEATYSIILPTYNRKLYIKQGIPSLLAATEGLPVEIVIWNNASQDGTKRWLKTLDDPRLTIIESEKNIGINALAKSVAMTTGKYILQVDDDVLWFPKGFIRDLLRVYLTIPDMGYLGTNVIWDEFTSGGRPPLWRSVRVPHREGLTIDYGAVGGWCTLTDRVLYDQVGGFLEKPAEVYYWADLDYYRKVGALGRKRGVFYDLSVYHAYRVALSHENARDFEQTRAQRDPEGNMETIEVEEDFWSVFNQRYS